MTVAELIDTLKNGAAAGLPNGSKRCENSHAAAFYKKEE